MKKGGRKGGEEKEEKKKEEKKRKGPCFLLDLMLNFSPFTFAFHSGLNFIDLMVRQGNIDNPPKTPLVPGFECSGIVEALGDSVKGYEVMF